MQRNKIVIVALIKYNVPNGICKYISEIINQLAENEEIVFVIGQWQKEYFTNIFKLNNKVILKVINIPNSSITRNLWLLFGLPRFIFINKYRTVLYSYPIPFIRYLFKNNASITTVIHDLYPITNPSNFRFPFFNKLFTTNSVRKSTKLIAVSNETKNKIIEYFPQVANKTVVQYIPLTFSAKLYPSPVTYPFFLTVAQHTKNKNLDLVVEAFGKYAAINGYKQKLIVIGAEGTETHKLKDLIKKNSIEDNVIFLKNLTDEKVISFYQNCDIFLLISSTEGLGIPLVEALFYSKYIICSDIPVFKELDSKNSNFINLNQSIIDQLLFFLTNRKNINSRRYIADSRFTLNFNNNSFLG
jgi:glycosyltransferase involved in cell wall biosynthesis